MLRFLLDTDHVSLFEQGHPRVVQRVGAVLPGEVAVSSVTVEESLRGRVAYLARPLSGPARVRAYALLLSSVRLFNEIPVVLFDDRCEVRFQDLRSQKIRIGSQDLRIAAVALVEGVTLVTRNRRDFDLVPGLQLEDWSV